MAAAFSGTVFLAFYGFGLPVSILSLIWEELSEKMTVAAAFVGVLRALIALGAVISCILSERIRSRLSSLDLAAAGLSVEALGVIGISLSRLFWHLCVWVLVLGAGFGFSLTLLTILVFPEGRKKVEGYFTGTFLGIGTGALLISSLSGRGLSWRTICQAIGIVQICLVVVIFFLRRMALKRTSFSEALRKWRRGEEMRRLNARREIALSGEDSGTDYIGMYLRRVTVSCAAAALSALILLGLSLWPESYRVLSGFRGGSLLREILAVTSGGALGCLLWRFLPGDTRTLYASSTLLLLGCLIIEQVFLGAGMLTGNLIYLFAFLGGAAEGPIFPALILIDDVRLDRDAELALTGLIPAFYLGSWVLVTPLGQALVGGEAESLFALWLLLLAMLLALCLFYLSDEGRGKRKKRERQNSKRA